MNQKSRSDAPVKEPRLSRLQAPTRMPVPDWQRGLRRQFGRDQAFTLDNTGAEPFFSDFRVGNPQAKTHYRVAIRGLNPGDNFCACADFATNELGTCKHIEFALARLQKQARRPRRPSRAASSRRHSRVYLRYGRHASGALPRRHRLPAGCARRQRHDSSTTEGRRLPETSLR